MNSILAVGAVALLLTVGFQNCAGPVSTSQENQSSAAQTYNWLSSTPPSNLPEVNYFKTDPPANMTGRQGYSYLYNEYFKPKCIRCHIPVSGVSPQFGSSNISTSYNVAVTLFQTREISNRITHNGACPECDLDTRGEVYQAVMYWLDHR